MRKRKDQPRSRGFPASGGFVRMPRKAVPRPKKRGGASLMILLMLVLLMAGIIARRVMRPLRVRYAMPQDAPRAESGGLPGVGPWHDPTGHGENLTPEDERALSDLIRHKSR